MDALHNLAICFLNGHGCVKDPATAAELFLEAAEAGLTESMSAVSAEYSEAGLFQFSRLQIPATRQKVLRNGTGLQHVTLARNT
jgi:TPR repeat protein